MNKKKEEKHDDWKNKNMVNIERCHVMSVRELDLAMCFPIFEW